jgi:drug/metabolite transporter (DMT)-like permease
LISGVVGADAYGSDPALGVLFGVLTAIAYSAFLLVLRAGNRDTRRPAGPLFDATASAALACAVAGLALGELDLVPSWPAHGWLLLLAITAQVFGWLVISVSLPRLPAARTSLLLTIQPAAAVIFAMILIDEQPSGVQLLGIVVVLMGILWAAGRGQTAESVST